MKTCPHCSTRFPDTEKFCPNDGTPLNSVVPPTEPVADPLIGKLIAGRFRIVGKLGEGGMGAVYKAEHTKMNRMCAIKIMSASFSQDRDARARFDREAQMSSKLDHPHAIYIYDFGEAEDGLVYLAMEYVEGETLATTLKREGPLPMARVLDIARQAGQALEAAHKLNIVHRDLKPDNIMIGRKEGRDWVKVLDFGIAKVATSEQRDDLTQAGMVVGTPLYMSPEQLSGEKLDARSDVYSFALIVYQMISGSLPFRGENTQAVMIKRLTEPPLPFQVVNPAVPVPPAFEAAIMRALARDRTYRCPGIGLFVQELETAVAGTHGVPVGPAASTVPQQPPLTNAFPSADAYRTTPGPPPHLPTPGQGMPRPNVPIQPTPGQGIPQSGGLPPTVGVPTPGRPMAPPAPPPGPMAGPPPGGMPGAIPGALPGAMPGPPPMAKPAKKGGAVLVVVLLVVIVVLGGAGVGGYVLYLNATEKKIGTTAPPSTTPPTTDNPPPTALPPAKAREYFADGVKLMETKEYSDAEKKFRAAIAADPEYADAFLNLATALYFKGDLPESANAFKKAAELEKTGNKAAKAWYGRGFADWEMQNYEDAADDFDRAHKADAGNGDSLALRGFMLQLAGKISDANAAYDDYLAANGTAALADSVRQCRAGEATPPATPKEGGLSPEP